MKLAILVVLLLCLSTANSSKNQPKPQPPTPTKCQQKCNKQKQCLQQCKQYQKQFIKTILTISITTILICITLCGCCFLYNHTKFRKLRLIFDSNYKMLKQKYNKIDRSVISVLEFSQHMNYILELLNYSHYKDNFSSMENNGNDRLEKTTIKVHQIQTFLYQIQLKGEDDEGDWSATGSIVCTSQGVICWFYKQYDNDFTRRIKTKLGKLVYVSNPSTLSNLTGTWYQIQNKQLQKKGIWEVKTPAQEFISKQSQSNVQIMN